MSKVSILNSLSHELFMKTNIVVSYSAMCKRIIVNFSCVRHATPITKIALALSFPRTVNPRTRE